MTSAVAQVSQGGFSKVPLFSVTNINKAISHFKDNDFWITSFENNIGEVVLIAKNEIGYKNLLVLTSELRKYNVQHYLAY